MKKVLILMMALLTVFTAKTVAQTTTVQGKVSFSDRVNNAAGKIKQDAIEVGNRIGDAFGSVTSKKDMIKVKGVYYMPLYSVNLYQGTEANDFRLECQREFQARYPRALITSCALPQKDWVVTEVKDHGQVVGFLFTMYCYVIATDRESGYFLNAKYAFKSYKEIGGNPYRVENAWPVWERTDVMTKETYARLLTK